jgi:hypothetical protein
MNLNISKAILASNQKSTFYKKHFLEKTIMKI